MGIPTREKQLQEGMKKCEEMGIPIPGEWVRDSRDLQDAVSSNEGEATELTYHITLRVAHGGIPHSTAEFERITRHLTSGLERMRLFGTPAESAKKALGIKDNETWRQVPLVVTHVTGLTAT